MCVRVFVVWMRAWLCVVFDVRCVFDLGMGVFCVLWRGCLFCVCVVREADVRMCSYVCASVGYDLGVCAYVCLIYVFDLLSAVC